MTKILSQFYPSLDQARLAVDRLERAGFDHNNLSIFSQTSLSHAHGLDLPAEDVLHQGDKAEDAKMGAVTGAVGGGGLGLLAGLGVIVIPGIGPLIAAGWVVSTLSIAGLGAAFGAAAGSMGDDGVTPEHWDTYKPRLEAGEVLVLVKVKDQQEALAQEILTRCQVEPSVQAVPYS